MLNLVNHVGRLPGKGKPQPEKGTFSIGNRFRHLLLATGIFVSCLSMTPTAKAQFAYSDYNANTWQVYTPANPSFGPYYGLDIGSWYNSAGTDWASRFPAGSRGKYGYMMVDTQRTDLNNPGVGATLGYVASGNPEANKIQIKCYGARNISSPNIPTSYTSYIGNPSFITPPSGTNLPQGYCVVEKIVTSPLDPNGLPNGHWNAALQRPPVSGTGGGNSGRVSSFFYGDDVMVVKINNPGGTYRFVTLYIADQTGSGFTRRNFYIRFLTTFGVDRDPAVDPIDGKLVSSVPNARTSADYMSLLWGPTATGPGGFGITTPQATYMSTNAFGQSGTFDTPMKFHRDSQGLLKEIEFKPNNDTIDPRKGDALGAFNGFKTGGVKLRFAINGTVGFEISRFNNPLITRAQGDENANTGSPIITGIFLD
jgi:hypothetical protein